jgi:hypothetical protein
MSELVNYLNDPAIVANFQKVFGIEAGFKSEQNTIKKRQVSVSKANGFTSKNDKTNGLSPDDARNEFDNYKIHSQFWFYLFHLGAAMGNELFYSLFFPFWVRRLMFV